MKIRNSGAWDLQLISADGVTRLRPGAAAEVADGADVLVSAWVTPERFAAEERLEIVRRLLGTADSEWRNVERTNG